jgi:hypothetical protein
MIINVENRINAAAQTKITMAGDRVPVSDNAVVASKFFILFFLSEMVYQTDSSS